MEARIVKLEEFALETRERLARIETRLEETATKADLNEKIQDLRVEMHKGFADIVKWMVGLAIVMSASAVTVMTFVLNNAIPKAPPPAPQPPVIVYPQPAAPAPLPKSE
jgi:hypothetical protein